MKKKALVLLLIMIVGLTFVVSADASSVEGLFPGEGDMGYDVTNIEMLYKKHPIENYSWDTIHEWFKMEGIKPVIGNANELMSRTILSLIYTGIININRLAIFCLQMSFDNNILDPVIQGLESVLAPISRVFYENMAGFLSLLLAGVLLVKFAQGRKGEGVSAVIKAAIYTAIIFGVLGNISWLLEFIGGLVDYISLSVIGTMCLSPFTGDQASTLASAKIIEVSNTIFELYIKNTWIFGEFGSIVNIPTVSGAELDKIRTMVDPSTISYFAGQAWDQLLLQLPDGAERFKLIQILCDPAIQHDPALNTVMLVSGAGGRTLITLLAFLVNFLALILYAILGILQFAGKLGLIILSVSFIFLVVAAFIGEIGERILRAAIGLWLFFFFFRIATSFYMGIPIAIITLLNKFNVSSTLYIIMMLLHIIINVLTIFCIPLIWTKLTPALMRATARVTNSIGNPKARLQAVTSGQLEHGERTLPPLIKADSSRNKFAKKEVSSSSSIPSKKVDPDAEKIKNMSPRQEHKFRSERAAEENDKTAGQVAELSRQMKRDHKEQNREIKEGMAETAEAQNEEHKRTTTEAIEEVHQKEKEEKAKEKAKEKTQADLNQRKLVRTINQAGGGQEEDTLEIPPPRKY